MVNKKDFACTENHTHLQQSPELPKQLFPMEPSTQLGIEVPGGADAYLPIVGICLLIQGTIMFRAMAEIQGGLEREL